MLPIDVQNKYKQIASSRSDNSIPPNIEKIKQTLFNKSENSPKLDDFLSKLEPQPIGPYEDVINLESFQQTNVPITYIKCKYDISLPKETFDEILSKLPASAKMLEIDADHEAMFSNPKSVANILLRQA
jgi:pimeloyl-ACP methyl ester carboxylesterase